MKHNNGSKSSTVTVERPQIVKDLLAKYGTYDPSKDPVVKSFEEKLRKLRPLKF